MRRGFRESVKGKIAETDFVDDSRCIACGSKNPHGLKLKFKKKGNSVYTSVSLSNKFQGYKGILHGGMVCLLLDEAMAWTVYNKDRLKCVTARILVKFKKPVLTNRRIEVRGWLKRRSDYFFISQAQLIQDGLIKAEGESLIMKVK